MESGTMPIAVEAQQTVSPSADRPAAAAMLIDLARLEREYFECLPDLGDPDRMVRFGASGHGGSPLRGSFTEAHILAITQAICDFRRRVQGTDGPLYMGKDTHALSTPAQHTALQVLAANGVETVIQQDDGVTPAPVVSHAILAYNRDRKNGLADGIVLTASHNPPEDGGLQYNPPNGGPAGTSVTHWVEARANQLLRRRNSDVKRVPLMRALLGATTHHLDFILPYVKDLRHVVDMEAIRRAGLKLAADPLGGAAKPSWERINSVYGLEIAIVNPIIDPAFSFLTGDHDGKIPMDCSSPRAMARLVTLKDAYRLSFGNDPDSGRHGIVTPAGGLMHPNHYLPVAIRYLLTHRPKWHTEAAVGKTLVTTDMIDRVVRKLGRRLCEVPAAFQWFAPGLLDGSLCFGGEAGAGATFLRRDGAVWTTDKDGLIMNLLAAEITARTGKDPHTHYQELTAEFGTPCYTCIEVPATAEQKALLERLSPLAVKPSHLAGQPILAKLTRAPGSEDPIGGLKVVAATGWFAARPSGARDNYKIYAESFWDEAHLDLILADAREIVKNALNSTEPR
jgi:phosphoglucomutase